MLLRANDALLIAALLAMSGDASAKWYLSDIQNGQAFRDRNGNGLADGSELAASTGAQGSFQLPTGKGRLYVRVGNDRTTGVPNHYLLTTPGAAGSIGILTSTWQALLNRHHSKLKIARELNLPIHATPSHYKAVPIDRLRPGSLPLTLLKRNAELQNLLRAIEALVAASTAASVATSGANTSPRPVEDELVGVMADALNAAMPSKKRDWKALDLGDADTVKRVLRGALSNLSLTLPSDADLGLIAQAVVEINNLIRQASPSTPDLLGASLSRGLTVARLVTEGRYAELSAATSSAGTQVVAVIPDTGNRDNDGVTSDWNLHLIGVAAEAAVSVRVTLDNGMTGNADLVANRQWTWTPNERLTDGSYGCTAVGIAADGSESEPSPPMTMVIDTTPPDAATVEPMTTLDSTPLLTGTWNPAGNSLEVVVNGRTYRESELTVTATAWSLQIPTAFALPNGLYNITTRVTDLAGNVTPFTDAKALLIEHPFSHLFSAPTFIETGPNPFLAKLADFNNDGKSDLAVVGGYSSVSILPGNGDGSFQPAIEIPGVDKWPFTMGLGNLDGDSNVDLLVGAYLLLGNGDFSFRLQHLTQPGQFELADLSGDGLSDLVGTLYPTSVYVNEGLASFAAAPTYSSNPGLETCAGLGAAGDLNGDDKMDVVHVNSGGCIAVQLGNGDGTLRAPAKYGNQLTPGYGVLLHDMNNDGSQDIVSTSSVNGLLLNDGHGHFSPPAQNVDTHGDFVAVGDFDGDNEPDIALTRGSGIVLLMNGGNGNFNGPYTFPIASTRLMDLLSEDLNGDGKPDLIMADYSSNKIAILLNQGTASP